MNRSIKTNFDRRLRDFFDGQGRENDRFPLPKLNLKTMTITVMLKLDIENLFFIRQLK